jgi:hypothetical protein
MADDVIVARFEIQQQDPISASMEMLPTETPVAEFKIETAGATHHPELTGRDLEDQHPIGAITGLSDELASKATEEALEAEILNREQADLDLYGEINEEAGTRASADTALGQRIDNEVTARTNADTSLGNRISAEEQARIDEDEALDQRIDEVVEDLSDHIDNENNPHNVTKAQLGLGNVDNTSDLNKPVSTAQANAIQAVQDNLDQETDNRILGDQTLDTNKQDKLTSANAGTDITITEEGGVIKINSIAEGVTVHNDLTGRDAEDSHPISAITGLVSALGDKQDTISDLSTIRSNALAGKGAADTISGYGDIVSYNAADFATAAQGAKADTAVQNLSDLGITATANEINLISGATSNIQTQLNGKQATISDLSTIRSNAQAGKNASDTISGYGDIVTHDVDEFATAAQGAKADSAVQNLSDLGITASATEINYIDGVTSSIQTQLDGKQATISDIATIRSNASAGKSASDTIATYGDIVTHDADEFQPAGDYATNTALTQGLATKQNTISDLTTIRNNASSGKDASDTIATYGNIVTHNVGEFATSAQGSKADSAVQPDGLTSAISTHNTSTTAHDDIRQVANEALSRASQAVQSLVFDTFEDMEDYLQDVAHKDLLKVGDNLYIKDVNVDDYWVSKVLTSADPATGYYYEISPLSGEKPDLSNMVTTNTAQTISGNKNFTGTLQKGGANVATESYVTSYHDGSKQDSLVSGTNIKTINSTSLLGSGNISVATAAQGTKADNAAAAIATYGDIVTHDVNEFATAAQGSKADSALQSITGAMVTTALGYTPYNATNPNSYISRSGISATSPIAYNNSTGVISVASGYQITTTAQVTQIGTNASDISNLEGVVSDIEDLIPSEATNLNKLADKSYVSNQIDTHHDTTKQDTLVSGTNIKTINGETLLGSGNIEIQGSMGALGDLTDVTISSPANGQFLTYNGSGWVNGGIKTINSTSLVGSGNISVQATLVSGTNIKTINSTSLLGSGNISVATSAQGALADSAVQPAAISDMATKTWVGNQGYITSAAITGKENTSNKVTSMTSSSTNTQYPSAKAVYTALSGKQATISDLSTIRSGAAAGATAVQPAALSGYVPTTRTVNGKALSANISLSASDVSALANTTKYGYTVSISGTTLTLKDQNGASLSTATIPTVSYTAGTGIKIASNVISYNGTTFEAEA